MDEFICLADLPELAPEGEPASMASEITLAKTGRFKHRKYGPFRVTRDLFDKFIARFEKQSRVPIDIDHSPEKGKGTEAAGWITALRVHGEELKAKVEWTKLGADAIRDKRYLFISPTWALNHEDEAGEKVGPALIGAGMTNRPFFDLPVLSLSQTFDRDGLEPDEQAELLVADDTEPEAYEHVGFKNLSARLKGKVRDPDAVAAAIGRKKYGKKRMQQAAKEGVQLGDELTDDELMALCDEHRTHADKLPDSRAAMDRDTLIKIFSLDEDATDAQIESAAREYAARPEPTPETGDPGLVGDIARLFDLDPDQADQILTAARDAKQAADTGEKTKKDLSDLLFNTAFDQAVDSGCAMPSMRSRLYQFFELDQEGALATIKSLQPIVPVNAKGKAGAGQDAPDGVEPESYAMDLRIKAHMAQHDTDYVTAFSAVVNEGD